MYTLPKCSVSWRGSQALWELVFIVMGPRWALILAGFTFGILLQAIGKCTLSTIIALTDIEPGCAGCFGPCLAAKVWDSM